MHSSLLGAGDAHCATFPTIQRFHIVELALGLPTTLGAVAGNHGLLLCDRSRDISRDPDNIGAGESSG
jgi:hypothetical protein